VYVTEHQRDCLKIFILLSEKKSFVTKHLNIMSIPGGTKYFCQSHYIGSTREPLLPDGYHRGEREEEKKMWVIFTFFIGRQSLFICLDYFPRSTLKLFIHLFTHIFFQSFNYNPIQFFSGTNSPHFELA